MGNQHPPRIAPQPPEEEGPVGLVALALVAIAGVAFWVAVVYFVWSAF